MQPRPGAKIYSQSLHRDSEQTRLSCILHLGSVDTAAALRYRSKAIGTIWRANHWDQIISSVSHAPCRQDRTGRQLLLDIGPKLSFVCSLSPYLHTPETSPTDRSAKASHPPHRIISPCHITLHRDRNWHSDSASAAILWAGGLTAFPWHPVSIESDPTRARRIFTTETTPPPMRQPAPRILRSQIALCQSTTLS